MSPPIVDVTEQKRLKKAREAQIPWKKWGPYLSERQWGTVREDYSDDGNAWNYFTHDQARSRAYAWGEDGLGGLCDDKQRLCVALALWNERAPILKERLYGLTNSRHRHLRRQPLLRRVRRIRQGGAGRRARPDRSRNRSGMTRIASLIVAALAAFLAGCASLPSLEGRTATTAFTDTAGTKLGRAVAAIVAENPGKTGVHALPDPRDAFAARMLLAAEAEKSLDLQYFMWYRDEVGFVLLEAVWHAAERGVRVRLLLDDLYTKGFDPTIATLGAHPNIEVRLYNPFVERNARGFNYLTDFARVNRRMHNKSFTVDNQVSVVGGRNIGNEYFGAGSGFTYADLDVIAIGAVVPDVSGEFDLYWNSASAYPAASFVGTSGPEGTAALEARFAAARADPQAIAYGDAVRATPLVRDVLERRLQFEWTITRVVYDNPGKTLDTTDRTDLLLFPDLVSAIGRPEKTLDLVSPYFVPGEHGTAALVALAAKGVAVRILTNSLASNDVTVVYANYAKRRQDLLRAGVRLYELKATVDRETREGQAWFGSGSSSALHAKTFAVDHERVFVGSFNFDPRSARLNTEMGLVIDSPALAQRLAEAFDRIVPLQAYEVRLGPDGKKLEWIERSVSGEVHHDVEPGSTWFLRAKVNMLSILPIEWLL